MRSVKAAALILLIAGCRAGVAPEETIALDQYPRKQVLRGDEWRWARRIPGGGARMVELGVPQSEQAYVRLGLLPRDVSEQALHVDVLAGDDVVVSFKTTGPLVWTDRRVELGPQAKGQACRVRFRSARDFMISTCMLVDRPPRTPNVIIALIDAVRADHLGCYGYARPTSPHIDALAGNAVRFENCIAQSSWTRPSVATLLTGCYPSTHAAVDRDSVMQSNLPTLGGSLSAHTYETHAYIGNPMCLPIWGTANEFDRVLHIHRTDSQKVGDNVIIDKALAAVEECRGIPFFLYLHLVGLHTPYTSREPYNTMFGCTGITGGEENMPTQDLINCYDAELAFSDVQIGRLVDGLRALDLYDDTVLVVTADHGEQFYEHGAFGHGMSLHVEEVRIPMIIKLPNSAAAGTVCNNVVEMIDLAPTLLELLGIPAEPRFQGASFAGVFQGRALDNPMAYASLQLEKKSAYMAQNSRTKFIKDLAEGRETWFNLERDPLEQQPMEAPAAAFPGGPELVDFANAIAALETHGLNVLITTGQEEIGVVSGRLRGEGVKLAAGRSNADDCKVREEGGGVAFEIDFAGGRSMRPGAAQWHEIVQQESAQLRFSAPGDADLLLDLEVDGRPVSPSEIFLGPPNTPTHPQKNVLTLSNIVADSRAFDPLLLDRRFAVYVWYVPMPKTISDDALAPEVRDAMQALGYLK